MVIYTVSNIENGTIEQTLDTVFENSEISYRIDKNVVYLSKSGKTATSSVQPVVKGKVTDINGIPLIGVSIKAGTEGSVTDTEGNYSIIIPKGEILQFSYLGFISQSVKADKDVINVIMREDTEQLSEVVVTAALGIKRSEKALSYNVQQVSSEQLTTVKDANFVNALSGKVAGVVINSSAVGTGGSVRVVMRGMKSIEKNNAVLTKVSEEVAE